MTTTETTARHEALALLTTFCQRILPCVLRRIARWHGIPLSALVDLGDDIRQELAVDCLEHAEQVVALSPPQRHTRWMRKTDRWIYRQRQHRHSSDVPAETAAPAEHTLLPRDGPQLVNLRNGRVNIVASANHAGTGTRRMRGELEELAAELGCDRHYDRFWRRRLAEAMTGLAADLLQERSDMVLLGTRAAPRPESRLRRLRRVGARFHIRPSTRLVRELLQPWLRRFEHDGSAPRRLLQNAVLLAPENAATWLWLFEACCGLGDLRGAAEALRSCRQQATPSRTALTLARARLLEARQRWPAAIQLLRRAAGRWPFESKLRRVLAAIERRPLQPIAR